MYGNTKKEGGEDGPEKKNAKGRPEPESSVIDKRSFAASRYIYGISVVGLVNCEICLCHWKLRIHKGQPGLQSSSITQKNHLNP